MTPLAEMNTASEVAAYLSVSPDTVRRWARDGRLRAVSLPSGHMRFLREDIEALIRDPADIEKQVGVTATSTEPARGAVRHTTPAGRGGRPSPMSLALPTSHPNS